MGEAIGQTLPLAVAVAISPIGIIAAVVMLTTDRGASNGTAFLIGWFVGLLAFGGLLLLVGSGTGASSGGEPAGWTAWAKILLGLVLLNVARRQWQKRPGDGEATDPPGWLEKVEDIRPFRAIGLGFLLGAVNPKNLILTLGAATAIAGTGEAASGQAISLLAYALIGSLGAAAPLGIYLFTGDRAAGLLERLKESMSRNGGLIMAVICVVIAAKLIGDGITTL